MTQKIKLSDKLWATKLPDGAASPADYYLWREIDHSDTIIGHFYFDEQRNSWELDAGGSTYKGVALDQVAREYQDQLGQ